MGWFCVFIRPVKLVILTSISYPTWRWVGKAFLKHIWINRQKPLKFLLKLSYRSWLDKGFKRPISTLDKTQCRMKAHCWKEVLFSPHRGVENEGCVTDIEALHNEVAILRVRHIDVVIRSWQSDTLIQENGYYKELQNHWDNHSIGQSWEKKTNLPKGGDHFVAMKPAGNGLAVNPISGTISSKWQPRISNL